MMLRLFGLVLVCVVCSGHVGSPDVWYSGSAGPYALRVRVKPPEVVPGLAQVTIRVRGGARRITVAPARSDTGDEGQPPPDIAVQDANDPEVFTTTLWLMARGAYRIVVSIEGSQGAATTVVPVTATATERLPMSAATTLGLGAFALFLVIGMITIVGAAVRESVLPPGEQVTRDRKRFARISMIGGAAVIGLVLFGGWRWWSSVDQYHKSRLDRPWSVTSDVDSVGVLRFAITDSIWLRRGIPTTEAYRYVTSAIAQDHGKLMHMFLIRDDQQAFAHLHPTSRDQNTFNAVLPQLPAGRYRLYADLVHETGFAHTLTDTVEVPAFRMRRPTDADDTAWQHDRPLDRMSMTWIGPKEARVDQPLDLGVEVIGKVEPYMGMPGHAVVERSDGSVFIHLHPLGTISMAAQHLVAAKSKTASVAHETPSAVTNRVVFPYAFPKPGNYKVWVQVRLDGELVTSAFDVAVSQ